MSNERIDLKEFEDLQHSWRTRSGIYDELFSEWIEGRKEEIMAELKRCYEELDEANKIGEALWNALDNWDICMDDYSMHDLYNNLDEKYARDYEGRIILKELYSYTEEDGWQPKEHASE